MGQKDRRIDVLFAKAEIWIPECERLRDIMLSTTLNETFKWRGTIYTWNGENVVNFFRLKARFGIGFFRGSLLSDPDNVLVSPSKNAQADRRLMFTSLDQVNAMEPIIRTYVDEAIAIHASGKRVAFVQKDALTYPEELIDALAADPELSAAFDALTPGRQRSWVLHLENAKQSATRVNRIARGRDKIMLGKGQLER